MDELVLLVLAAAWAAVLIPPLLRSRIENRPNSSVTDFRRQLNRLQSTVPNRAAGARGGMARPLAQSPLHRPAAAGRPGMQSAQVRRGGTRAHGNNVAAGSLREAPPRSREAAPRQAAAQRRSHGDPTGGQARPHHPRQTQVARHNVSAVDQVRRRRSNVLFMLVLAAGSSLFLAATTKEPAMLYLFAAAFLGLCGYMWMLAQARQREAGTWGNDWM